MTRFARTLAGATLAAVATSAVSALPTVAAAPAAADSPGGGLLQAMFGMVVVLALIFGLAWAVRRLGLQRLGGSAMVRVVSSAAVGTRERVVVVEVAGTWLVLGVTGSQVSMLHSLPAQAEAGATTHPPRMAETFALRMRDAIAGKATPK